MAAANAVVAELATLAGATFDERVYAVARSLWGRRALWNYRELEPVPDWNRWLT